jgi:hypothetical protein
VKGQRVDVENGQIKGYQVNMMVTFVLTTSRHRDHRARRRAARGRSPCTLDRPATAS